MIDLLLSAITLFSSALPQTGSPFPATPSESTCVNVCQEEITNTGERECLSRHLAETQKQLDTLVASVRKELSAKRESRDTLQAFERSQSAWSSYHVAECQADASKFSGGTIERTAHVFCLLEHSMRRAYELWRNYHLRGVPEPRVICDDSGPDA